MNLRFSDNVYGYFRNALCILNLIYPALILLEQSNCIAWTSQETPSNKPNQSNLLLLPEGVPGVKYAPGFSALEALVL
jgi:hypothetical protein